MNLINSIPYIDAKARVSGQLDFILNFRLPGMLHAAAHRSIYPHARLVRIDTHRAQAVPGVAAVLTRQDIVDHPDINSHFGPVLRDQPIVAIDKARFVGEPIAAVAAVDRETAEYAASLIEVEYEELPAVIEIDEALAPGAPLLYDPPLGRDPSRTPVPLREVTGTNICNYFTLLHGDSARGMAEADAIFEDTFETPAAQHVALEPHVTVAHVENGRVTLWSATQTPYIIRQQIAELFHLPQNRVRVIVTTLGGGYGGKTQPKLEPLTAALAWKAGAPVKFVTSRAEEFVTVTKNASRVKLRTGVKASGELVARECEIWFNGGAYADRSPTVCEAAGLVAAGPYRVPHVKVRATVLYTNRPPAGAFRGFGSDQLAWAYESQMDMIAERLGLDPVELRRINLLREGDTYYTGETLHDVAFQEILDAAAQAIRWGEPSTSIDPTKARGKGVALTLKGTIAPSTSTALVRINADGSCVVLSSTVEVGQGSKTILTQITADELGLPYERVTVTDPDTDVTPYDLSTNASRSTHMMGGAVKLAAQDAKRQLVELAAGILGVDAAGLEVRDGGVYWSADRSERSQGLTFAQVIQKSASGNVVGVGTHRTQGGLDPETGQGIGSVHWHHASSGAEVEVDTETGVVRVLKLHTAIYTGRSVNSANVELQTEGNACFGLGRALMEEMLFDHGKVINANLSDYLIPSFRDLPAQLTVSEHQNPDPQGEPHGIGETGLPPVAPAIGNAIANALGVRVTTLPLTPEKILDALESEKMAAPQYALRTV